MPYKRVKVKKNHDCYACGGNISKGQLAFVETIWDENARYPRMHYFHADGRSPHEIATMSLNRIRAEICTRKEEK